jgi:outer membrane protein assembly factor BamB
MKALRLFLCCLLSAAAPGGDWPEFRGSGRQGIWREEGILRSIPAEGLKQKWRTSIRAGYSGPAVSAGRVYLMDFERTKGSLARERAICLDEESGRTLWTREWEADYRGLDYPNGPRATPTVDGERVYVLGAKGALRCLRARDGAEVWAGDFGRDFGAEIPAWGSASAPLVVGERLIAVAGGKGQAKVVAFDKTSGRVLWKALSSEDSEPGYSQPVLIHHGQPQVIIWHATALESLNPATGEVLWSHPFRITMNTPIATPAWDPPHLLVSGFFNGARLLELTAEGKARLVWASNEGNEVRSDKLHTLMSQPLFEGDFVYGVCSYGQLRCLRRGTGERVWESQAATVERARNASAWLVREGDRVWIFNDRGELILARLSPQGYEEQGRTKLIAPTTQPGSRRELQAVVWAHPAFANRHILVRNDEEIARYSLDATDY